MPVHFAFQASVFSNFGACVNVKIRDILLARLARVVLVTGRRGELGIKRILSPGGGASGLASRLLSLWLLISAASAIVRRCLRVLFHVQHVEDFSDENVNLFPIVPTRNKLYLFIILKDSYDLLIILHNIFYMFIRTLIVLGIASQILFSLVSMIASTQFFIFTEGLN